MDALTLQAKLFAGYAKAAQRLGLQYGIYRPVNGSTAFNTNLITTVYAQFTEHSATQFSFGKPHDYKAPEHHILADLTLAQNGDYMLGPNGETYFIANIDLNKPPLGIVCNATVTVTRRAPPSVAKGFDPDYGATSKAGPNPDNVTLASFPASLLRQARGNGQDLIPGEGKRGIFELKLPAIPGFNFRPSDNISDAIGFNYTVSLAELTSLGWRLFVEQQFV